MHEVFTINARNLNGKYIFALALIAALSILAHSILLYLITAERTGGALINLSGRQRMLTQKAALLSAKLVTVPDTDRIAARAELNAIADELDRNQQLLIYGDPALNLPPCPKSVQAIFFSLPSQFDQKLREYIGTIRKLASEPDTSLTQSNPLLQYIVASALGELFVLTNQVVNEYQLVSEKQIDFVRVTETGVLIIILLALLLEGLYVFRPMVRQIETNQQRLELLNQDLAKLSTIDSLTAIANRRQFDVILQTEWSRLSREKKPLSLAMIDIDHFKSYNDTYGHQTGDNCLVQVARAIQTSLKRSGDFPARYGGEEFAVILPDTDQNGALHVAEEIRLAVEQAQIEHKASPVSDFVTVSVGVATIIPGANVSTSLIKEADEALYAAKASGRNRVEASPDRR